MKNFTKALLITASTLAITSSSIASSENVVKIPKVDESVKINFSAYIDFQAGFRNQAHLTDDEKKVSKNRGSFAFNSTAAVKVDLSNTVDGVTYGGKIILVPTAKRKGGGSYNGSHLYVQSEYGRFEAGSPFSASSTMMISGMGISAGSASNWARYADFTSSYMRQGAEFDPSFTTSADFFLDSKLVTKLNDRKYSSEPARSIAFYTPKYNINDSTKIQIGISYTPDSSNTGADSHNKNSSGVQKKVIKKYYDSNANDKEMIYKTFGEAEYFEFDRNVKDAISTGICLEKNFSDGVDLKLALSGEFGKAAKQAKHVVLDSNNNVVKTTEHKLSNLKTYNIGAVLNVGNFAYSAAYGSLGESLTTSAFNKTGRETDYYTATVAYNQGPFATSLSYRKIDQFTNITEAISIGTDYQLAPGFKPYASISAFSIEGRPEYFTGSKPEKRKTRGTVALIGAKLSL